jgi:hypothetical protein
VIAFACFYVLNCRARSLLLALLSTSQAASTQQQPAVAAHSQQQSQQQQQATTDVFSTQRAETAATDNASTSETADGVVTAPAAASQGSKGVSKQRAKPQAAAAPVPTRCALDGLQFAFSDVRVIEGKFAAYRITLMVPVTNEQLQLLADDSTVNNNNSSAGNSRNSNRQSAINDRALSVFGSLSGHGVQYCKWEVWRRITDFGALRYVTSKESLQ